MLCTLTTSSTCQQLHVLHSGQRSRTKHPVDRPPFAGKRGQWLLWSNDEQPHELTQNVKGVSMTDHETRHSTLYAQRTERITKRMTINNERDETQHAGRSTTIKRAGYTKATKTNKHQNKDHTNKETDTGNNNNNDKQNLASKSGTWAAKTFLPSRSKRRAS